MKLTGIKLQVTSILFFGFSLFLASSERATVGQWQRFEVEFKNTSWKGNPFDLLFEATFTSPSGKKYRQFGFYAGQNRWKIYFMPTEKGKWVYRTYSPDEDLEGKLGMFRCVGSELEAPMTASGKKWKVGGEGAFPVIWAPVFPNGEHWGFRGANANDPKVIEAMQFAEKTVGARFLGIGELVVKPVGWAKEWPQSAVPYTIGKEGDQFFLEFWDQLNAKLDAARDRNMGIYLMVYGDDEMNPNKFGATPHSKKELRLFRYIVARLACYPHVLWDTGIDISEYRDNEWIDWFADWFLENDAWQHPVSSRSGGGSGGKMPENGTYFSTGGASLPSRTELLETFIEGNVPIAQTDHWRPFISRGNWTVEKIRIAVWRCGLSGAQALYPDFNQGEVQYNLVEKAGKEIGVATYFFRNHLHFGISDLQPHDELITKGEHAIVAANLNVEYVIYDEDGGDLSIDLKGSSRTFWAEWYNPKNGEIISFGKIKGGTVQTFSSPTVNNDWVLHIYKESIKK